MLPIRVATECQAIFRVIDQNAPQQSDGRTPLFHVPAFPSLDAIDPAEKLYEKRKDLDADIVELLLCIDWKINFLIKVLSPIHDDAIYPYRAVILEISMNDIKISSSHPVEIGTLIELHFVLPTLPFKEMFLKGEVIAFNAGEYLLTISAEHLKAPDQEHLLQYLVRRQFQLQRKHHTKR